MSQPFRLEADLDPEHEIQRRLGDQLRVLLRPPAVFTSWDAATKSKLERIDRARRHVRAGWPDCGVWFAGRVVLVELKLPGRYLSASQRELHPLLADAGHPVVVAHSEWEAIEALRARGVPLRG